MRLVVADTGPLNYLVLIEATELLPKLFEKVFAPEAVRAELLDQDAPAVVRAWAAQPPGWLDVRTVSSAVDDPAWRKLDIGEREALALARTLGADLVLMDDRAGVAVARQLGLAATGTLGVLDLGARRGMIDLADAFTRLKATSFRYRPEIMDALLAQHAKRGKA
jgi:predicted nucleic acid-binding protein